MTAPTFDRSLQLLGKLDSTTLQAVLGNAEPEPRGRYYHWHKLRALQPPDALSSEQWWAGIKLQRKALLRPVGELKDLSGTAFRYARVDSLLERLHHLDQLVAGHVDLPASAPWTSDQQERYIVRNFIEEAIASSQLEGAATTRKRAKEMIRLDQRPTTKAEQMILNNYQAITRIAEVVDRPLTAELIIELHAVLTEGTLEPESVGRFQTSSDERVVVGDNTSLEPHHVPPPAEAIPKLIEALCAFANEEVGSAWIHPLVRAVTLHFMLGWIHPFEDGNGRAARALFYWSALRARYWPLEYVSISRILLKAPGKYATSFLYTETDENDLTYFILYQLDVIESAVTELLDYVTEEANRSRQLRRRLRDLNLNHRQEALLSHALTHPDARYTFYSHADAHRVVQLTARNDILELVELGLIRRDGKIGRAHAFTPASTIHQRIQELVEA